MNSIIDPTPVDAPLFRRGTVIIQAGNLPAFNNAIRFLRTAWGA